MKMPVLITPVGMLITTALLGLYGAYAAWVAFADHSVVHGIASVVSFVACVGTAMLWAWSRYLVYALTAGFVAAWAYSLYLADQAGYWSLYSANQIVRQLAPAAFLALLSCVCAFMVFRHFRRSRSRAR
jgi:hypothetical protein